MRRGFIYLSLTTMKKHRIQYNRIKAEMANKGINNKELAAAVGKTEVTVSRWCTNEMQPDLKMLFKIAKVLKVTAPELVGSGEPIGVDEA